MSRPLVEGQSVETADLSLRLRGSNQLAKTPTASLAYYTTQDRRILLVHGYNVPEKSGLETMVMLRCALARRSAMLGDQCLTVTWPGNRSWIKGGPAAYHKVVPVAVRTAEVLHEYLMAEYGKSVGPKQLVIIAHSLGCRVTMELLGRLKRSERPERLEKVIVILMAAAVPAEMADLIQAAVANTDEMVVLHSMDDTVLRRWFPPGQTLAGEGDMPEAIGLRGLPTEPGWSHQRSMPGFDHDDYWGSAETADAVSYALKLYLPEIVLRRDLSAFRRLPETSLLETRDHLEAHVPFAAPGADV